MADELIDICDESNNLTGVKKMKSEAHKEGLWHRTAHIWIYNPKGEILLQLRAKDKELYPDMWDISAAGHIAAGEDASTAGVREIQEEIGLEVNPEDLQFFRIRKVRTVYKKIRNNEFYNIFFLRFDGDIRTLRLQDEEVQEIRFLPCKRIEEELKADPEKFVPHGDYWFEVIDEVKRRLK
ncbi:MAG TPA: NUDIX domain-containing protein [Candidatus Nanoarchaeia archaeon]|nr:NUDIX domain-containing protein [Candidatus Nanoarchaeia archaeon]